MARFPDPVEMLEFFGCEPRSVDPGPSHYGTRVYDIEVDVGRLRLEMHPAEGAVCAVWTQEGRERLRLDLHRVEQLRLEREEGQDTLVLRLRHAFADDLRLRVRPHVHLQWGDRHF